MDNFSDEKLVHQYLKDRDEEALEKIVKRYLPIIFAFVKKYTGNEGDASDITQEVFVKVWKNLKSFDQSKSFRTWIFTIAKRTAIDWLRRKNALPLSAMEDEEGENFINSIADDTVSIFDQLSQQELSKSLAFAINKLPAQQRSVINLRVEKNLTFNEIAQSLNMPLNTVKSHYRRGVSLLKKIVDL